jgi:hypothetical protein
MSSHPSHVLRPIIAIAFAFAMEMVVVGAPLVRADPGVEAGASISVNVEPVAVFFDELAPYGEWISDSEYGWIWVPAASVVGTGFVPYASNGRWVYTDTGWFFESDFAWGWAPFHYGRWFVDASRGWVWVPGRLWAPAWVDWRVGAGFIGWSPRPPRRLRGSAFQGHWYFVNETDFRRPHIRNYILPQGRASQVYRRTAMVRQSRRVGDARIFRGPRNIGRGSAGVDNRPIRIVPPRRKAHAVSRDLHRAGCRPRCGRGKEPGGHARRCAGPCG